jgi:alpha-D-glucose phosphate-specific phosphoglucomutase
VPVGFKWFVPGLMDGSVGFGGEESAGASFLRRDGTTWTTDKDGILLALLAERDPRGDRAHAQPALRRAGRPARRPGVRPHRRPGRPGAEGEARRALARRRVTATTLAGEEITGKLTEAPGNGAKIGGLKVTTENAWFAARPSGTEDVYKIYAESFRGPEHLAQVQDEARDEDTHADPQLTPTAGGLPNDGSPRTRWSNPLQPSSRSIAPRRRIGRWPCALSSRRGEYRIRPVWRMGISSVEKV